MPTPFAHGQITLAIGLSDRIIIASDSTSDAAAVGLSPEVSRAVEVQPGFVVAGSGIWKTSDQAIDTRRDIQAAYRHEDTAESFLQRFDRLYRQVIQEFLTRRFHEAPNVVLRECFCPLMPPLSLVVCEVGAFGKRATIFEYIPTLTNDDQIVLTPLVQAQDSTETAAFAAIGAAAPYLHLVDRSYVDHAMRGPSGPEQAARTLVDEAIARTPTSLSPACVFTFPVEISTTRQRTKTQARVAATKRTLAPVDAFPPVDTKDIVAVEQFVRRHFSKLYPTGKFSWLPTVFRDIDNFFAGRDPDYAAVDLRYHDLEHTLQAAVCTTLILAGRHAARVPPRIDAHHFELAITAALLHDSGYLKLRSDTRGTGAKYTFCHVLRSCAFAASYLPNIGATGTDIETVMSAINCTGPMNEISRLRFQAPVDEIIGCAVATADYLGQLAAVDYPDELNILFEEFQESDDFIHVPAEERMFKSAYDLVARTPQFWHRFVLPKLENDFHGVYRFLARPFPDGPNPYLIAVEANIAEIQRRFRRIPDPQKPEVPSNDTTPPMATESPEVPRTSAQP